MSVLYLIYWGNGCTGAYSGKDLQQVFYSSEVELGMRLGQAWATGEYSEIKIVTPSELQKLREQRGLEPLPTFKDYLEGKSTVSPLKALWIRAGMSVLINEDEEKVIFDEKSDVAALSGTFRKVIAEGRATLDGDSYIPFSSIEEFNRSYDTHYEEEEFGFGL